MSVLLRRDLARHMAAEGGRIVEGTAAEGMVAVEDSLWHRFSCACGLSCCSHSNMCSICSSRWRTQRRSRCSVQCTILR